MSVQEHYEFKIYGSDGGGNFFQNVIHYNAAVDDVDSIYNRLTGFITAWDAAVSTPLLAMMSQDCQIHAYSARKIDAGDTSARIILPFVADGAAINPGAPAGLALNLRLLSDGVTGQHNGHFYVAALHDEVFADDTLVATLTANALAAALLADIDWGTTNTASICIFERPSSFHNVTDVSPQASPAYLPRRARPFG
jgi:hypothetical protein